jgi:transposase
MLTSGQYKKILTMDNQGQSIRSIRRFTGHSRNTIRKVLDIRTPPLFKVSPRPSILDGYKKFIKDKFDVGTLSALQIYEEIRKNGYEGSYSTVRRHLSKLVKEKERTVKQSIRTKKNRKKKHVIWLLRLLQGNISFNELEERFVEYMDTESAKKLYSYIIEGSLRYRNRSITIFAHLNKIPKRTIANLLGSNRNTVRSYIKQFESGGIECLFDFSRKEIKKYEKPRYKKNVFKILHSPPSCYGFNRTTWRMEDFTKPWQPKVTHCQKPVLERLSKMKGIDF